MWREVGRRRHFEAAYELVRSLAGTRDGYRRREWRRIDFDTFISRDGRYRVLARVDRGGNSVRIVQERCHRDEPSPPRR